MSSISIKLSGSPNNNGFTSGVYLIVLSYPVSETVLMNFEAGTNAYAMFTIDSIGILRFRSTLEITETFVCPTTFPLNTWVWVSMQARVDVASSSSFYWLVGAWWSGSQQWSDGVSRGSSAPFSPGNAQLSFNFGYSPSGLFNNTMNDSNLLFSKPYLNNNSTVSLIGPPSSNWGTQGSNIFVYNCRQIPGAASSLNDNSGNAKNLASAPQGMTINPNGPFA